MKRIIIAVILAVSISHLSAQTASELPVKMYAIKAVVYDGGYTTNTIGQELNAFAVPATANSVKLSIQVPVKNFMKYRLNNQLRLFVLNTATDEVILNSYWSPLYKDTILKTACYFPVGNYKVQLVDNNAPTTIFASRNLKVDGIQKTGGINFNGYNYDTTKFKLWACQSVDETNWKPIGLPGKIKVGGCITFFFDSAEKLKNPGSLRWKLYRVEADGKETFINQRDQNSKFEEFRRMYYEECDEFRTPGKYRVYLAIKNESEAYYGIRDTAYFGKADITVE